MTGRLRVWTAWVAANSISELVGLSLVFATGPWRFESGVSRAPQWRGWCSSLWRALSGLSRE